MKMSLFPMQTFTYLCTSYFAGDDLKKPAFAWFKETGRVLGPWGRLVQPRAPSNHSTGGPAKLTHQDGCRLRRNLRQVPSMSFQLRILRKFLEHWT